VADFTLQADGCASSTNVINSLEHVQVSVTLGATRRGELELALTSPSGTRSLLLNRRAADTSGEGLTNWVMMTTHCWGEQPTGTWTLTVHTGATIGKCHLYKVHGSSAVGLYPLFMSRLRFCDLLRMTNGTLPDM